MTQRFLLVNIDKHQDDVTACDDVQPSEQADCAQYLTLIIDLEQETVTLGGIHRPIRIR